MTDRRPPHSALADLLLSVLGERPPLPYPAPRHMTDAERLELITDTVIDISSDTDTVTDLLGDIAAATESNGGTLADILAVLEDIRGTLTTIAEQGARDE